MNNELRFVIFILWIVSIAGWFSLGNFIAPEYGVTRTVVIFLCGFIWIVGMIILAAWSDNT